MELYLVRHATAEDRDTPGLPDEARRLTEQGQAEASLAARALSVMRIAPKAVLTSPLRRCVETARPIAALLEAPLTTERLLAPGFEATELAAISERYVDARSLILVGHEPDLSSVIRHLSARTCRCRRVGSRASRCTRCASGRASCATFCGPSRCG